MATLRYHLGLYAAYFRIALKILTQYRADFGIMAVSTTIREGATLLFLSVIFGLIPRLQGWSFYEIVLVYGLAVMVNALAAAFLDLPHSVQWYVQEGRLDILLIRPPRPLFQMLCEHCFNPTQAGGLLVGGAIVAIALARLGLPFQGWWLGYMPLTVVSGALLVSSITLIFACAAFWFTSILSILMPLGYFSGFAQYPLAIYARPIPFILTWILPYAMTAQYPAGLLLGKEGYRPYGLIAPFMGWLFLGLALLVWRFAVRHYKSTGT
jgi:ABC-2 type transport system permease protein